MAQLSLHGSCDRLEVTSKSSRENVSPFSACKFGGRTASNKKSSKASSTIISFLLCDHECVSARVCVSRLETSFCEVPSGERSEVWWASAGSRWLTPLTRRLSLTNPLCSLPHLVTASARDDLSFHRGEMQGRHRGYLAHGGAARELSG